MLFPTLMERNRIAFHQGFEKWEDAIAASCAPLLKQTAIEQSYIDLIVNNVHQLGPYIVIAPNICIPHAQEGAGVHETAVCFMKTQEPVQFSDDPDQSACLFFAFSSVNNDDHLANLTAVMELLEDDANLQILLQAKNLDDLINLP